MPKQGWFSELFVEFHPRLVSYLKRFVNAEDAADISMQVFVRLLEQPGFDDSRPPWPYLRTIARNLAYDHLRRERATPMVRHGVSEVDPGGLVADRLDLRRAMAHLPESEASVLRSVADGYKPAEIARTLGRTPHAVTCMLSRTRLKLRALLEPITIPLVAWWYRRRPGTAGGPVPGVEFAVTALVVAGAVVIAPLLPGVDPPSVRLIEASSSGPVMPDAMPRRINSTSAAKNSTIAAEPGEQPGHDPIVITQRHEFEKDEKAMMPRRIWFEYWVRDGEGNNIYGSEFWTGCETGEPAEGYPTIEWYEIIPYFESTC
ncbi:MAG: RNA polymerase sigma factor [Actinomycetota bacterium]